MSKSLKLALGIAAAVVVVLVLVLAAVLLLVDPNRFKPQLIDAARAQTGRELRIDGELGWSLFPVLGLRLGHSELANAEGFGPAPMLAVDKVEVGVALLPLLRRELQVSKLRLERPRIALARNAAGRSNWDDILELREQRAKSAPAPAAEQADDEEAGYTVAVAGLELVDAALAWRDAKSDQQIDLQALNLRTGAIEPGEPVDVELDLQLNNAKPELRSTWKLRTRLTTDATFDALRWEKLALELTAAGQAIPAEQLTLKFSGDGALQRQAQTLALQDSRLEFALTGLPGQRRAEGQLDFALQGDLAQQRFSSPQLALDASVAGAALGKKAALQLRTPLALDLKQQTLTLAQVAGQLLDAAFTAQIEGRRIVDKPEFSGTVKLAEFDPRALASALAVELPHTRDSAVFKHAALATRLQANTERVQFSELQLRVDDSALSGALSLGLGDIARVDFDLALDRIDADRYLPPEDDKPAPPPPAAAKSAPAQPAATAAADDSFAWLDGVALDGKLKVGQLRIQKLDLQNIALGVASERRVLRIDPLQASLYGGSHSGSLRLDAGGKRPQTELRSKLEHVNVGALLDALLEKNRLEGIGQVELQLAMSGLDGESMLNSARGGGNLRIRDGAVRGINVAQEIRNAIALVKRQPRQQAAQQTDFTELTMQFSLDRGTLGWSALNASSPLLRLSGAGHYRLADRNLDTQLEAAVVKSLKGQGGEPLSEIAGLVVPVHIRGTPDQPKVSIDIIKVLEQTKLGAKKEELEAELETRKEELRDKAKGKEDELKQKAAEELQRGLDKLFKRQ